MYSSQKRRNFQIIISILILLFETTAFIHGAHGGVIKRETVEVLDYTQGTKTVNTTEQIDVKSFLVAVTTPLTPVNTTEAPKVTDTDSPGIRFPSVTQITTIATNIQTPQVTTSPSVLQLNGDNNVENLAEFQLIKTPKTIETLNPPLQNIIEVETTTIRQNNNIIASKETSTDYLSKEIVTTQKSQVNANQIHRRFEVTTNYNKQNFTEATTVNSKAEDTTTDHSLRFNINDYIYNSHNSATPTSIQHDNRSAEERFHEFDNKKIFLNFNLTTPASKYSYNNNENFLHSLNDNIHDDNLFDATNIYNFTIDNENFDFTEDITTNSTSEKNSTILIDESEIESTNYDIATNEIKNFTLEKNPNQIFNEVKSDKYNSNNLTILPTNIKQNSTLDSVKNFEYTKEKNGYLVNITSEISEPHNSITNLTKQTSEWTEFVKDNKNNIQSYNNSFISNTVAPPNSIENTLEIDKVLKSSEKLKSEQLEQENRVISVTVDAPTSSSDNNNNNNQLPSLTSIELVNSSNNDLRTTPSIDKNKVEDTDVDDLTLVNIKKTFKEIEKFAKYIKPTIDTNNLTEIKKIIESTTITNIVDEETTELNPTQTTELEETTQHGDISHTKHNEIKLIPTITTELPTTLSLLINATTTYDNFTTILKSPTTSAHEGEPPSTTFFSARKPKTTEGKYTTIELPSFSVNGKEVENEKKRTTFYPETTEIVDKIFSTEKEEVNGTDLTSKIENNETTIQTVDDDTTLKLEDGVTTTESFEKDSTLNLGSEDTTVETTEIYSTVKSQIGDTTIIDIIGKDSTLKLESEETTFETKETTTTGEFFDEDSTLKIENNATTFKPSHLDSTTNVETTVYSDSGQDNTIPVDQTTNISLDITDISQSTIYDTTTEEPIESKPTTESVITFESFTAVDIDRQSESKTIETTTIEQSEGTNPISITDSEQTTTFDSISSVENDTTPKPLVEDSIESNLIDKIIASTKKPSSISSTTEQIMATLILSPTTESIGIDYDHSNTIDEQHIAIATKPSQEYTTIESIFVTQFKDIVTSTTSSELQHTASIDSKKPEETDYNVIIAVSVSVVGIIIIVLVVGFLYVMRKRQKQITYGQRCRPVSLDAYSLDNVSIFNSVRRKGALRASKRTYGNVAFDDPSLKHNVLTVQGLAKFVDNKTAIREEFADVPQIIARADEVPPGCEDKNRYANVIPLPETRVILEQQNNDEKTEYINANFVRGPKDQPNYYIACQAPLESTVGDFWRMIWEQNSRVIIMATDLVENGIEKCAEYLPPSMTLDNHTVYGDYQITLKNREVKEKYAVSTLHVKNMMTNTWREITHFWYQWPETGVPSDESSIIAMLLEARTYLKTSVQDQNENDASNNEKQQNGKISKDNNDSSLDKTKVSTTTTTKTQGALTVHCSPGTGRTGTIIACDVAIRCLETPKRSVDIPQIVYYVRRGRASAVQTKEQYEFIYRVSNVYATKITGPVNDN